MPKSKTNKRQSAEQLAKKAILEAKLVREASEEMIRKDLSERYYPQIQKFVKETVLNEEDDTEDDVVSDEDLEDLEDALDEGDSEEEFDDLDEGDSDIEDEEFDDLDEADYDLEDEEDLEESEEGDDEDDDGHVEVPTDEVPDDDEEVIDEEYDEEFLAELASLLEEEDFDADVEDDLDDLDEVEGGDDVDAIEETEDGINKGDENAADVNDLKEEEEADLKKENNLLRRTLSRVEKQLQEVNLDNKKSKAISDLIETYKIKGASKLRVLSAIDEAKSERELNVITQSLRKQYKRATKKGTKNESVTRRSKAASSTRKPKRGKKSKKLEETNALPFADRWAELSGVKRVD